MLFLFPKIKTQLPGGFHDIKNRLALAFKIESTATISITGIMGNVIMGAVVAACWFIAEFCIHEIALRPVKLHRAPEEHLNA